ncbi:hypothetical protein [Orientia tsutsugamushi]|uniref:hypothetical protein n=1 Tax=Orientia tsutsugamushi TaxID=784 RepID=UPI000D5A355B|nr:Uncharacterised protein [Orientia tsutsugamushi]
MSIRILRFIIGFIALVNVNNIYAVEYENDIFMYPQNAAEVVVHESGYLFIAPREEGSKVYLTVIGEHKAIQDLMLTFTSKTSSPVMLVTVATDTEEKDNSKQNNTNLFSNDVDTKELTAKPSKKQSRNTKKKIKLA